MSTWGGLCPYLRVRNEGNGQESGFCRSLLSEYGSIEDSAAQGSTLPLLSLLDWGGQILDYLNSRLPFISQ